jgi:hypothetical protein
VKKVNLSLSFNEAPRHKVNRNSSVGMALGYGLEERGSRVRFMAGAGNFSLHHRVQNGSRALCNGYVGPFLLSPGEKWPRRGGDHSPTSSTELKNAWSLPPVPNKFSGRDALLSTRYIFITWSLITHGNNFTFDSVIFPLSG